MRLPVALDIVRERVKPARDLDPVYADCWWRLWRPRPEFRQAIEGLPRFIAGTATSKRVCFVWCEPHWRPSNSTNTFALSENFAMGVLSSTIHIDWSIARSSTMRTDPRYTPSSAFDTFPWPQTTNDQREQIGALSRELLAMRSTLCTEHAIGLTVLYNRLDDGAFDELRSLHRELDLSVIAAYGWEATLLADLRERNRRLYDLNRQITCGEVHYGGPG